MRERNMAEEKTTSKQSCKKCGAEFSTPAQIKRVAEKLQASPEYLAYCPACKRARLAAFMAESAAPEG